MIIRFIETFVLLFGGFFIGIYLTRKYYLAIINKLKETIYYNNKGMEIRDNKIKGYKEELEKLTNK